MRLKTSNIDLSFRLARYYSKCYYDDNIQSRYQSGLLVMTLRQPINTKLGNFREVKSSVVYIYYPRTV